LRAARRPFHHAAMIALLLTPAVLSSLVLAAHFLRRGQMLLFTLCMAMCWLSVVRKPWARRVWQALLGLGALTWLSTLASIARVRLHEHQPVLRTVIILSSVAAFTLLAALLLEHRRAYAHFDPAHGEPPVDAPPEA
jgi:hypothetical protein